MRWLEKNWLIVLLVVLGYMWFNGTLGNLLTPGTPATAATPGASTTTILGG